MRPSALSVRVSALSLALLLSMVALGGCKKKTPLEKTGDKIEDLGDKAEDKLDEAN
jgi:hypothetical protein